MSKNRKHKIRPDAKLNPELRNQVQTVRGGMMDAAEQSPLPDRFKVENDADYPCVWITDSTTGRRARVSLFAYRVVRDVLSDLFL